MKIGDIVTSFWKGYWEIVAIDTEYYKKHGGHYEGRALIHVKKVYDDNGKPVNSKQIKACDSAWCKSAKLHIDNVVIDLENKIKSLKELKSRL